jgi:hypothetical protein
VDSCYLCEIGTEGLFVPAPWVPEREILVCTDCTLNAIYRHPKLAAFLQVLDEQGVK